MKMDVDAIRKQSESAYKQWAVQWREQAKTHSKYPMKSWEEFHNAGIGRAVVAAANGYSLEKEMPTLIENKDRVDILCCDKSLGHLIKNGIRPTYCMVCDANVDYEKYLKPYENELQDTILFMNVCGNPKWTENGNWKDRIFFVNMDVLGSEKEFMALSGCKNVMPAGTNVSNAMIVLLTQCDNEVGRKNFFGYDKILLVGFDYSWEVELYAVSNREGDEVGLFKSMNEACEYIANSEDKKDLFIEMRGGSYYAYDRDGGGKANYMRHVYTRNFAGKYCCTSTNLAFSAVW